MGYNIQMKKVLIFGVNGYLGGLSAVALFRDNWQVHGIGTKKHVDKNLSNIVKKYFQIKSRIAKIDLNLNNYSHILFCISLDHHESEKDYRHTLDINCGILGDIIQASKFKSQSTKIIYLSTMQVYKDQKFESNITDPINIYGYTHLACENLLKLYGNTTILRLSNVYGPPQTIRANVGWTLIADLCKSIAKHNNMIIKSDGTAVRNFLFSEDFQNLLVNLVSNKGKEYMVYDVIGRTTSSVGSIKRILEIIANDNGKNISVKLPKNYVTDSEKYATHFKSSLKENSKKLVLVGETELFEGLRKTIKYYEEA